MAYARPFTFVDNTTPALNAANLNAMEDALGQPSDRMTINAQTGTTYTLVAADAGKRVERSNAAANTTTIPLNSSVAFPVGTVVEISMTGAGQASVVATGGVTLNSEASMVKLAAQWTSARLLKTATDTWVLEGALIP